MWIKRATAFHSGQYNHVRIRMRVQDGTNLAFDWKNGIKPEGQGVSVPIFPDGAFHVYDLPLQESVRHGWCGTIREIRLRPSDVATPVDIAEVVLSYKRPPSPRRVTLVTETFESLPGTQAPWELTVPANAIFEAHVGVFRDPARKSRTDGAFFKVFLEHGATRTLLVKQAVGRYPQFKNTGWIRVEADLAEYADQPVRIRLVVDDLRQRRGEYPYWGNPVVFAKRVEAPATPVILISCDTLRARNLPFHGYDRDTAPHLNEFIKEAVVFDDAVTPETWTLTAHISMLTGLYPKRHSVTPNTNLSEEVATLAEVLSNAGYFTAGFVAHDFWMFPRRGYSHGFDIYNHPLVYVRDVFSTLGFAKSWLNKHAVAGPFMFLHNYDIHRKPAWLGFTLPYEPPAPEFRHFSKAFESAQAFERPGMTDIAAGRFLRAVDRGQVNITPLEEEYLVALYDDAVRAVDQAVHEFLEELKKHRLYDDALIIITSDHGESFNEHGRYGHSQLYKECAHIPLIIRFPQGRFAGRRVSELVQLTDLFPTVLDVLNISLDWDIDGRSLLPLLEGEEVPDRVVFMERKKTRAVRTKDWKLLHNLAGGGYELYNVSVNEGEQNNLIDAFPEPLGPLKTQLEQFFALGPEGWHFAFHGGGSGWEGELRIAATGRLEHIKQKFSDRMDDFAITYQQRTENGLKGRLSLKPRGYEKLFIGTVPPKTMLAVTLTGKEPFSVCTSAATTDDLREYEAVLDPTATAYTKPVSSFDRDGPPALRLWYQEPIEARSSLKHLPEKTRRELEALGYVD